MKFLDHGCLSHNPGTLSWCLYFSLTLFLGGGDDVVFGEPTVESPDFQLDKVKPLEVQMIQFQHYPHLGPHLRQLVLT